MLLPLRADVIAAARGKGQRPDAVVFVAIDLQPTLRAMYPDNWAVACSPQFAMSRFDFSWCLGLDIEIVAERVVGSERAVHAIEHVAVSRPRNLVAWETDTGRRWWLQDELGAWPKPYRIESDRCLTPERMAA